MANYNFKDPGTVEKLDRLVEKYEHLGEMSSGEGNETERSLSGQLILLTTVLLTANVLFLGDGGIIHTLTHNQKEYIFTALILEAVATVAGIVNYLRIESYYNKWAKNFYGSARIIRDQKYKTPEELDHRLDRQAKQVQDRGFRLALWFQILTIIASLIVYMALLFQIFFD